MSWSTWETVSRRFLSIPLTEAERLVCPPEFSAAVTGAILVNLTWVERATHAGVLLKDGERLPMSRTFYTEFQNAIVHRLNG